MNFTVVIPARFGSTRLPGKPLADIAGKPMIEHVYRRASQSGASRVLVATDDARVKQAVEAFGGEALITRADHVSGTDRLQEVAQSLGLGDEEIVVNVQGDEPLLPPQVIDQVAVNLAEHPQASVATLCEPLTSYGDFRNPNIVKALCDRNGYALYFSRAPIPWPRDDKDTDSDLALPVNFPARRHIGLYAYRVALLNRFVGWQPAVLEITESLEQLRVLAYGEKIHLADAVAAVPGGVDTPEDLARVQAVLLSSKA
ncbi:3-deoxy-manno-octulosonate cytidylyltransferase [Gilvimarinus agarilyticus]|uniref:3-deoxy-manno-octulosonate cytidylyltransferase n=1 Tax=unclassified Gilvimarinus TaxID=2642066 RepID=UPI001C09FE91|nr:MULTISPECIES: 3-deoxy-manno-octulosonate cytidylyltransferase [unclassified Gilvimarinus]MBU2887423.1 3-deoxy-manno-octulosonate cytidylyltransferase [Gilvimarinus agarilyticus]MDO6572082.1 3-deoxy-manno-octulosonate cytidylyltransferase [Gilvimarinus sp. 2_MG-2023]MDO6746143.1 3-deoxy-manno-octulosonate cytidylyltransferase [Gilvimarinus sp. 1_MG-2023]